MQLEHVEAAAFAAPGGGDELALDPVHRSAVKLTRHLAVGEVGNGRSRYDIPAALFQRPVHTFPHQFCCALAASMAELQANFRVRISVNEIDDAVPYGFLLVVPETRATMRDTRIAADAGHLGEDQPGAANGTQIGRASCRERV